METGTFYKPFPKKLGLLSCITYASTVPPGSLSNCSWFILLTDMERNNLYFPLPVPNLILVSSTHSFTTAKNGSLASVLHSFELCFYLKSSQSEFQPAITEGETSVSMRISKVWREDQKREEEASGCPTHAVWQLQRLVLMICMPVLHVVFHSMIVLSMAEGPSRNFVLIRDGDRSIFCFPFDSEFLSAAQTEWELLIYQPKWHCCVAQKLSPGMPIIFRHNLARRVGCPPKIVERVKQGQMKTNPLNTWVGFIWLNVDIWNVDVYLWVCFLVFLSHPRRNSSTSSIWNDRIIELLRLEKTAQIT